MISDWRFQISDFRFQISDFRFQIENHKSDIIKLVGNNGARVQLLCLSHPCTPAFEILSRNSDKL